MPVLTKGKSAILEHYDDDFNELYEGGGELRTKSVITEKIGWLPEIADYFISFKSKISIWLADSILDDMAMEEAKDAGDDITKPKLRQYRAQIIKNQYERTVAAIRSKYGHSIRLILDWLQHPLAEKQNLRDLTFRDAVLKARKFHDDMEAMGGDVNYVEEEDNTIFLTYPRKDDKQFYWVYIPSNFCDADC